MLAILGGSGLTQIASLEITHQQVVSTPYGEPSGALCFGNLKGRKVMFLARHGHAHTIPPHKINYRANIWALHSQQATNLLAVASVGGIHADLGPGVLAIPEQIIDYTHGRESTFFDTTDSGVIHVDFTKPYDEPLRMRLLEAAVLAKEKVIAGGTYATTQGPRLETAAEINRLERDGADMVGMTGMPEAALAREIRLPYAAIAVVVNHAAGRGSSGQEIKLADINSVSPAAMLRVQRILEKLVELHDN
jgi:5'-methylthioadenosine phosphorylase